MNPGSVVCNMMTGFSPVVQYSWKLLELGDPQSSREKENFFFSIYEMMDIFLFCLCIFNCNTFALHYCGDDGYQQNLIWSSHNISQVILYTVNLNSAICQLCLNKRGRESCMLKYDVCFFQMVWLKKKGGICD